MNKLLVSSLKMLYRDKQALFWALAFPIIFATVFGLFDLDRPPEVEIAVIAEQPTPVGSAIVTGLHEVDSFIVSTPSSLARARAELADGDLDVVLAVPGSQSEPLTIFYDSKNFDTNRFALATVHQIIDGMNLRLAGVETPPLRIETQAVEARSATYYDFLLPGLVAMGVMNFSIIGMAVAIARFREQRILKRILATPLAPMKFLSAQVLSRLALSLVQAALILAVGVFVFGATIYGNVLWLFVLATVANLIFLNIGFAVAARAKNPDAAQGMGNAIALPMMFMAGVFFPTDLLPTILQAVVKVLPLTPLIEALRTIAVDGQSITATGTQLAMLGGWVAVSFVIAARTFKFARA